MNTASECIVRSVFSKGSCERILGDIYCSTFSAITKGLCESCGDICIEGVCCVVIGGIGDGVDCGRGEGSGGVGVGGGGGEGGVVVEVVVVGFAVVDFVVVGAVVGVTLASMSPPT